MTASLMTKSERADLARLARMREKAAKGQVEQRAAELLADATAKLSAIYRVDDAAWADVTAAAKAAAVEADREVAKRCEALGIPPEFRPSLSLAWYGRGQNAMAERRQELRATARSRIEAEAKRARAAIEAASLEIQTQILSDGLTSEAARGFLESMPSPAELMPAVDIQSLDEARAAKAARRGGEHHQVARYPVPADELARRARDQRHDLLRQVFVAPAFEQRHRVVRQRRQVELGEFQYTYFTATIAVDDFAVGALEGRPIQRLALDQELDPSLVAVAGEQRVVEIEEG